MLDALVYKQNHVIEKQKLVQASHDPIFYRLPRSRLYVKTYYTGFALGMLGVVYGSYSLIFGKPAEH